MRAWKITVEPKTEKGWNRERVTVEAVTLSDAVQLALDELNLLDLYEGHIHITAKSK